MMRSLSFVNNNYSTVGSVTRIEDMSSVPAPRLVGIELNPGPKSTFISPAAIAMIASSIASVASPILKRAKTKTKAPTPKKKVVKKPILDTSHKSRTLVSAPASIGYQIRGSMSHSPFTVRGHSLGGSLVTNASNVFQLNNASGAASSCDNFDLDLLGGGSTQNNFKAFPLTVTNVCASFTQYRWKKLILNWVPTASTNVGISVAFGVTPETSTTAGTSLIGFGDIALRQVATTTPVWSPVSLNLLAPGGLRSDWLFLDSQITNVQSQLRQECAGSIAISGGGASVLNTTYGYFYLEFEVELQGLALETQLTRRFAPKIDPQDYIQIDRDYRTTQASSSSSSSTPSVYVKENERYVRS